MRQLASEEYKFDGQQWGPNGLVYRSWYRESNQIEQLTFCKDDLLYVAHNIVSRMWYRSGQLMSKTYYTARKCHNVNGPARCEWDKSGNLTAKKYYIRGELYTEDQWRDKTKSREILAELSLLLPYPIAEEVKWHYCKA